MRNNVMKLVCKCVVWCLVMFMLSVVWLIWCCLMKSFRKWLFVMFGVIFGFVWGCCDIFVVWLLLLCWLVWIVMRNLSCICVWWRIMGWVVMRLRKWLCRVLFIVVFLWLMWFFIWLNWCGMSLVWSCSRCFGRLLVVLVVGWMVL